jgi:hypothetical protein
VQNRLLEHAGDQHSLQHQSVDKRHSLFKPWVAVCAVRPHNSKALVSESRNCRVSSLMNQFKASASVTLVLQNQFYHYADNCITAQAGRLRLSG